MILPSDEDSRKSGDSGKPGDDAQIPWEPPASAYDAQEEDGDEEEEDGNFDNSGQVQSPAPPGWREELKAALFEAVDDLKEIEDPGQDFDPPEPPDLFTFYGELAAMRNELRRGAKKSADALRRLAEENESAGTIPETARPAALALVYLFDRFAETHPKLLTVMGSAMQQAGLQRVVTTGAVFDAATMVTDGKVTSGAKVASELEAGFLWHGRLLRPARVEVS